MPLSEREDSLGGESRASGGVVAFPGTAERETRRVAFDRKELFEILKLYGRKVAEGEWRDYAIDHLDTCAVFSIFRRTAEAPLYRIEKTPKLAAKQGTYSVVAQGGLVLKRGQDLSRVLAVIDRKPKLVEV
jgi:hypothetical protein